jgi:hypothetical protein
MPCAFLFRCLSPPNLVHHGVKKVTLTRATPVSLRVVRDSVPHIDSRGNGVYHHVYTLS